MTFTSCVAGLAIVCSLLLIGCREQQQQQPPNEKFIRKADNPAAWPFTTSEGLLKCERNPKSAYLAAVTFTTNGVKYGGAISGYVFPEIDPVMVRNSIGLYQVPLGDLITQGLELCNKLPEDLRPLKF